MTEPFKNVFNATLIHNMGQNLHKSWPSFDNEGFITMASNGLDALELKERSDHIMQALSRYLPNDFSTSVKILLNSLEPDTTEADTANCDTNGIAGWAVLPMSQYVAQKGQAHLDMSLNLLKEMTKRFTSEFAIRFFIVKNPKQTLSTLHSWLEDSNPHVRRLISEGTRPRLPWAMQLAAFIDDPTPILPLLEALKDDDSEYVRRSVANNLNDIAKDHPDLVAKIAKKWLKNADTNRQKLIRHACRTLIKQGHQPTLTTLGYHTPSISLKPLTLYTPNVPMGETLRFDITITSTTNEPQPLIIDYIIHHRKKGGHTTPKVFKWKTLTLNPKETQTYTRNHLFKPITTRRYYSGIHEIEIIINGHVMAKHHFKLILPQ